MITMSSVIDSVARGSAIRIRQFRCRILATFRPPDVAPTRAIQVNGNQNTSTGERILIVEVGPWLCGTLPNVLQQAGYAPQVALGVPAALERLRQTQVSLCLVGGAVDCGIINTLRQVSQARVLALIPNAQPEQALASLEAGADDCQLSSISRDEVVARIRAALAACHRAMKEWTIVVPEPLNR